MRHVLAILTLWLASGAFAIAATLHVSPILIDVRAPNATSTLTLRNDGKQALPIQIRVFRWTGTQNEPVLEPTRDVVVSPPAATLAPGTDYVVRVVRVSKQPLIGEESYRVLVDELPGLVRVQTNAVNFAMRYSLPVFFSAADVAPAKIAWTLQKKGNATLLVASNTGGRRLRLADLTLADSSGKNVVNRAGLVGYALGQNSATWNLPGNVAAGRSPFKLAARTEAGAIDALVPVQTSR